MPTKTAPNHWLYLHIPLLCLSYLLLLAAACAGLVFILQERRIKRHQSVAVTSRLPSLEALERFIYQMILTSFPLLTLGILIGAHWAFITRGRFWEWDWTETFSLVTWLIYALYLALRWVKGWRGRQSTYLALAGFGIILMTLVALFFFSPLHPMGKMRL
jgi:ABC-type transport system involved in cytochrome c biogenesis permease subunit